MIDANEDGFAKHVVGTEDVQADDDREKNVLSGLVYAISHLYSGFSVAVFVFDKSLMESDPAAQPVITLSANGDEQSVAEMVRRWLRAFEAGEL